jgi:hypothetical protein
MSDIAPGPDGRDLLEHGATPRRRRLMAPLLVAGAAVAAIAAAVALAAAASGDPAADLDLAAAPAPSASADADRPLPKDKLRRLGPFGLGGALHGEHVVKQADGDGYETIAFQRGEVTEVSNDSLTVKSEDGFTRTYAVTGETFVGAAREGIDSVEVGDEVAVQATVSGDKATASVVRDVEQFRGAFPHR